MISSGLVLHLCVGALLVTGPSQNKHSKVQEYKTETETEHHNEHPTDRNATNGSAGPTHILFRDSEIENSARQMTFTLFSNTNFVFLLCNCFAFEFGNAVVYTYIVAFAASEGVHQSLGNILVSTLGLSSLIGRVVLSILSQHPRTNTIILYTTVLAICGNFFIFNLKINEKL